MSIFDNIVFDEFTLLEGEQAEEYLKRKKAEKEKEKEQYSQKYSIKNRGEGKRSSDHDGSSKYYNSFDVTSEKDPKFNKAREIENHRRSYGDVMPKKTKSEEELKKARDKEYKSRKYAADVVENKKKEYFTKSHNAYDKYDNKASKIHSNDIDTQIARDAAARHYRRHLSKNESAFDEIEMI